MSKHSEITRQRISEGTRAALARKRAEAAKLANPTNLAEVQAEGVTEIVRAPLGAARAARGGCPER